MDLENKNNNSNNIIDDKKVNINDINLNSNIEYIKTVSKFNLSFYILILALIFTFIGIYNARYYSLMGEYYKKEENINKFFYDNLRNDYNINSNVVRYAKNLNRYHIYYRDYENIPSSEKVTEMDIAEDIALLQQNFYTSQQRAVDIFNKTAYSLDKTDDELYNAQVNLNESLSKTVENYNSEVAEIKKLKLEDKNRWYDEVSNYLLDTEEFTYYINDGILNRTFTNVVGVNIDYYMENETYMNIDLKDIPDLFNGVNLNTSFELNEISGYIMIPKEQPTGSVIQEEIDNALIETSNINTKYRNLVVKYSITYGASILILFLIIRKKDSLIRLKESFLSSFNYYLKIPFILKLIGFFGSIIFLSRNLIPPISMDIFNYINILQSLYYVFFVAISFGLILFSIYYIYYIGKDRKRFKNEFEYKLISRFLNDFYLIRKYSPIVLTFMWLLMFFVMCFLAYFIISGVLWNQYLSIESLFFIIVIVFVIVFIYILMDVISSFSKLGYYINRINQGEMIHVPRETGIFSGPINKLNMLSENLYQSVEETLQSERTKTDLITSVSHDLRTPLTSIINYVELLSLLPLQGEAKEYVEVLKQKSYRLQILIEDLFEAAKLSSYSMELEIEEIDIVQLFKQSLGEITDDMENADLDLRLNIEADKIILPLDGKRMWRVFENLLNNIVKYSPRGSRVYIDILDHESYVEMEFKNISSQELNFDVSQLFERFKRGDESRATEGSGLGLSIAKNIVDLHGGKMDIVIDGDLFKVILILYK